VAERFEVDLSSMDVCALKLPQDDEKKITRKQDFGRRKNVAI
jgi:hypothetical protein